MREVHGLTAELCFGFGLLSITLLFLLAWQGVPGIERVLTSPARRVLTNSLFPIGAQILNRAVDLVFAAFALRLLGVTGNGQYAIATVTWLYLKTISDLGLSVLVTREIAKDRAVAPQLLGQSTLLRWLALLALAPVIALLSLAGPHWLHLAPASVHAILLLYLSIIPSSFSEAINSVFNGYEQMHLPAILTVFTNLGRAGFGLAALFSGYGVTGLAGVAFGITALSALAFRIALRHLQVRPQWSFPLDRARLLLRATWPLLLNGLLITVFFRIDTYVVQGFQGDHALGIYDAAYKLPNLLPIIPAYFVMAIFPTLTRHAQGGKLRESFLLAAKFLWLLAWPIVMGTLALAPFMIRILGGRAFLPDAATALRILIWFAPLHFVNGVAQYAIIAVDQQRTIAHAYLLATGFNVIANLVLVPRFGYVAAAVTTVLTELVLFLPLARSLDRHLGHIPWFGIVIRTVPAIVSLGLTALFAAHLAVPLALLALCLGGLLYLSLLVVCGALGTVEYHIIRELIGRRAWQSVRG